MDKRIRNKPVLKLVKWAESETGQKSPKVHSNAYKCPKSFYLSKVTLF